MNAYSWFDLAGDRGSRLGARARRAAGLGVCVVAIAGLAAGCSGSSPSVPTAQASPTASAQAATSLDPAAYDFDLGGFSSGGTLLADSGYTARYKDTDALDHMGEAYPIIEAALPLATDLTTVQSSRSGGIQSDLSVNWQPGGHRDTLLPPGEHGERIYEVQVDLAPYLRGGDAVAYVWFLSRAEGDTLVQNPAATLKADPDQAYSFKLDKATAAALFDIFWVKGKPAAS